MKQEMETLPVCLAAEKVWEKKLKETKNIWGSYTRFWNAGSWVHPKDRGFFVNSKENKLGPKI